MKFIVYLFIYNLLSLSGCSLFLSIFFSVAPSWLKDHRRSEISIALSAKTLV
ncbi:hypothetical protein F383_18290 [Gossypium arboreum]|uniref:Uncharacterized protein n=1 Tax=Gossypium arboreum TaxID=29729 RepID=A0A0B0NLI5_GOSAR|nr:hypothetical protein F383_18290 [Gossypium arboreum]